jgi:hypothetical protein
MRNYKLWMSRINREIPMPIAGAFLVVIFVLTLVVFTTDWSTRGLPPPGTPGRYDWATDTYYKDYRMKLEAEKAKFFEENPEFVGLTGEQIERRMRERMESEADRGQ